MPELNAKRSSTNYRLDLITSRSGRITLYLICSTFQDGSLAEVFISHAKAGTLLRTMMTVWHETASMALQNGVPASKIIETLKGVSDETAGTLQMTDIPSLDKRKCSSIWDAIAALLESEYA